MEKITHKTFGIGEVIAREGHVITARFENGKECRFSIPQSFEKGFITAEGELKEEVEKVIEARKLQEAIEREERLKEEERRALEAASKTSSKRVGRKSSKKTMPTGKIATDYINYLVDAGYKIETDNGDDSTVYAYAKAVESVVNEEGITWIDLENNIDDIVDKYDVGGEKEAFGAKSNNTVINALKRFREYVESK